MDWWIGLAINVYWWLTFVLLNIAMVRPRSRKTFFALMVQDPKMLPRDDEDDKDAG